MNFVQFLFLFFFLLFFCGRLYSLAGTSPKKPICAEEFCSRRQ